MALDEDLSLAGLQCIGPSPVGLYQPLDAVERKSAVFDSSQKDLRTINSNRLAVFAASLQWADAVKVVSRGTPRSRTSVTWGIRWSVSAA